MAFAELDHFRAALNEGFTSPLVLCPELGDALKYIADRANPGPRARGADSASEPRDDYMPLGLSEKLRPLSNPCTD